MDLEDVDRMDVPDDTKKTIRRLIALQKYGDLLDTSRAMIVIEMGFIVISLICLVAGSFRWSLLILSLCWAGDVIRWWDKRKFNKKYGDILDSIPGYDR